MCVLDSWNWATKKTKNNGVYNNTQHSSRAWTEGHQHPGVTWCYIQCVVRPGQCVHVNLVGVDESHIFEHAEDTLQGKKTHTVHRESRRPDTHPTSVICRFCLVLPLAWCHRAGSAGCTWTRRSTGESSSPVRCLLPAALSPPPLTPARGRNKYSLKSHWAHTDAHLKNRVDAFIRSSRAAESFSVSPGAVIWYKQGSLPVRTHQIRFDFTLQLENNTHQYSAFEFLSRTV